MRGADEVAECGLRRRYSDSAVGDISRRAQQLSLRQLDQQRMQVSFGIEIKRRRRAP